MIGGKTGDSLGTLNSPRVNWLAERLRRQNKDGKDNILTGLNRCLQSPNRMFYPHKKIIIFIRSPTRFIFQETTVSDYNQWA